MTKRKRTAEHNAKIGLANIRPDPDGKVCPRCSTWKPTGEFGRRKARNSQGRHYLRSVCKTCAATRNNQPRTTPEDARRFHLKYRYGMTPEDYADMLEAQDGRCAVCRLSSEQKLHIDHCHATGRVRGLLCGHCNRAIGLAFDSPERLRALADYLEKT